MPEADRGPGLVVPRSVRITDPTMHVREALEGQAQPVVAQLLKQHNAFLVARDALLGALGVPHAH